MVDRLKKEEVEIEYCPTGLMLGDFFTKPLQGSLFRKMRDVVMGLQPITILKTAEELIKDKSTMNDESVELKKSPMNNVSAALLKDLKTWINIKKTIPIPIMNDNKERVAKDDSNVTFCNDCVFNERTGEKYEKTNILNDRPSYAEVANKQYVQYVRS